MEILPLLLRSNWPCNASASRVQTYCGSKLLWTRVFVEGGMEALQVTHPFDSAVAIDGPNLRAIAYVLEHGVKAVQKKRLAVLEHYRALEKSLRSDEQALKQGMDPSVRKVMGSKNLLLFKQMLKDAGVPDEQLFGDMVQGFRLTGPLEPSGLFPPKVQTGYAFSGGVAAHVAMVQAYD